MELKSIEELNELLNATADDLRVIEVEDSNWRIAYKIAGSVSETVYAPKMGDTAHVMRFLVDECGRSKAEMRVKPSTMTTRSGGKRTIYAGLAQVELVSACTIFGKSLDRLMGIRPEPDVVIIPIDQAHYGEEFGAWS